MSGPLSSCFSEPELGRIKNAVREAESGTSGEIRVVIVQNCDDDLLAGEREPEWRVYRQALREFDEHCLANTRDKTGVLVLLAMSEKRFQILADSGINEKFAQEEWDSLSSRASSFFRERKFADGVCFLVGEISKKLSAFFPRRPDDVNELPDDVIVEGGEQ